MSIVSNITHSGTIEADELRVAAKGGALHLEFWKGGQPMLGEQLPELTEGEAFVISGMKISIEFTMKVG